MTNVMDPPTNGTSTRKMKTDLIDVIGETLDSLTPDARNSFLLILDRLRDLPTVDLEIAVRAIPRVFAKSGTDGTHDDLLAGAVKFHRTDLKR